MKRNVIFVLLFLLSGTLNAQRVVASHEDLEDFMHTTTCIVYDDDIFNTYNSAIKTAVEQSWTITPYKFISMSDFKKLRGDSKYSFLVRTKVFSDNPKNKAEYTFLTLVLGKKNTPFNQLPEIASFPLSYYNTDYDKYDYKLGALLLFLQNHINLTYNHPELKQSNILQYYNRNISQIGNKTIYFTKEELAKDVNTIEKIRKYYSGNVKIVEPDDILQLIADKNPDAIILHIVTPWTYSKKDKCYKMLIGVSDGRLYYYKAQKITKNRPGRFLKEDFKNLNK